VETRFSLIRWQHFRGMMGDTWEALLPRLRATGMMGADGRHRTRPRGGTRGRGRRRERRQSTPKWRRCPRCRSARGSGHPVLVALRAAALCARLIDASAPFLGRSVFNKALVCGLAELLAGVPDTIPPVATRRFLGQWCASRV
jgi:hypothetical protein